MFGFNESAVLHRWIGQRGGKPAFAEPGQAFACRSEPTLRRSSRSDSVERGAEMRIFAGNIGAQPGDRVEIGGASYRISEIKRLRGWMGVHHLEMTARAEEVR